MTLDYHLGELGIDTTKQHETTTKSLCCLLDVVLAIPFQLGYLLNKWFNHALREGISINSNNWESEQKMMVENLMPSGASTAAAATGRGLAGDEFCPLELFLLHTKSVDKYTVLVIGRLWNPPL